jgi:hypothetical protein
MFNCLPTRRFEISMGLSPTSENIILTLGDFATDEMSDHYNSVPISISFQRLATILRRVDILAAKFQRALETHRDQEMRERRLPAGLGLRADGLEHELRRLWSQGTQQEGRLGLQSARQPRGYGRDSVADDAKSGGDGEVQH